jgi:nucleoid-associated protein YgaU
MYDVVRGDNLWVIARARLAQVRGRSEGELSNGEIAAYWVTVVEKNLGHLRSGNPDLIYPDEDIELPPVDGG